MRFSLCLIKIMYELKSVSPESEGIPSRAISRFIDKIKKYKMNIHSFAFLRRGFVAAEAYAKPFFDENFMHRMYSCSKSVVSLAVGKLVKEKRIRLTDKICDYFPEYTDEYTDESIKNITIEDMLEMSVPPLTDAYALRPDLPWTESFFKVKGVKPSGTIFDYNSSSTFILGVLVEKLVGKTFIDYLRPEFDKIGVGENVYCVLSPDGHAWGGSGVVCTMRDFIKICLLVAERGKHDGEILLPEDYLARATSKRVSNYTRNDYTPRKSEGYGYQFWITDKGYSAYGMGSQYAFFFPDKDLLFVCTGDTQVSADDFCGEFLYEWVSDVYDEVTDKKLDEGDDYEILKRKTDEFSLPDFCGVKQTPFAGEINGKKYILRANEMGIKWFRVWLNNDDGFFEYENARGVKRLNFGLCGYKQGKFPETNFYSRRVGIPSGIEQDCIVAAEWTEEKKLLIRAYVIGSNFGNVFITLGFKGDEVGVAMNKKAEFFMDDYEGFAYGRLSAES